MGKGIPPPKRCGPTDHTWLIPYGGENRSIMDLFKSVLSCGSPSIHNRIIVVDDTGENELKDGIGTDIKIVTVGGSTHSCAQALNFGLAYVETTWIWRM